jgi:hypothetical protein
VVDAHACNFDTKANVTRMTEEAGTVEEKKSDLTLFYTSAEDNRPTYRRGILDALCYPEGHIVQYSYRLRNVHPGLRPVQAGAVRAPTNGVIVFVDVEYGTPGENSTAPRFTRVTYFPLRRVSIVRFPSLKAGQRLAERERASYFLRLGEFVDYAGSEKGNQWTAKIADFDGARGFRGEIPQYFVVPGKDVISSSSNAQTAWEDVVIAIAKSVRLSKATFIRIGSLQEVGKNKDIVPQPFAEERVYGLRPGRVYRLNFSLFESSTRPPSLPETVARIRSSSSGFLQVDQSYQSAVSGISERSALIACKRTSEETISVLSIEVGDASEAIVNAPNPNLLVKISLPSYILRLFVILIFLGGYLVSLDDKVVSEMSLFFGDFVTKYPEFWTLCFKLAGAACLALAGWLTFRELPSKGAQ